MDEREKLVAPCGIDCGICELYVSRDNPELKEYLVSTGIPAEVLPCDGCNNISGKCPVIQGACATYECVKDKKVSFCFECNNFPCMKLAPSADMANILPHNMKLFNLSTISKKGIKEFISKSSIIKDSYYEGKMVIGKGPQLDK